MGVVMATCPVTGQAFETGIETDAKSFARISSTLGRVWCPYCKTEHEWVVKEGYIREGGSDGGATPRS